MVLNQITQSHNPKGKPEHVLVCLSPSPSNATIIRTAAKMAQAFDGAFTALYVQTTATSSLTETDKRRLQSNTKLAEQLGATVSTIYGDDISYQIAEFARISKVTKIIIGQSNAKRNHFWNKPSLTEKLLISAPNLEIHIIPDSANDTAFQRRSWDLLHSMVPTAKDFLVTFFILAVLTAVGIVFRVLGFTESNIITVYILGALLISLFTKSYFYSILGSLAGVLLFNFFFTEPILTFHAYEQGYPFTFFVMLTASLITGTLAGKLKNHAKRSAQAAFRTKVLFETNQLLQKAVDENEIISITATQLTKLLNRDIIAYTQLDGRLSKGQLFSHSDEVTTSFSSVNERTIAQWVYEHRKRAGFGTNAFSESPNLYLSVRINEKVYGVIGISINDSPLDSFENNLLLSIVGECALAIENTRNARAKEEAALFAQKEQLRANLLRAISHDLRTPLTSISGNAHNLLSNSSGIDEQTRIQMYNDIYDESQWLISLVENLLSVTRLEDGRLKLNMVAELVSDVIDEALKHVNRKRTEHEIVVSHNEEFLLAKMDAKLIIQVIINLVDNAIKYTPTGSTITIQTGRQNDMAYISVSDNGNGISDDMKPKVFDMFFTITNSIIDSRRSLGLGLYLCQSIIREHGGELILTDNEPHGCVFSFTLPLEEDIRFE
ncbi:MAG: DUF4118 domain-containing protein [bacterium]|nr:DUF4118 domain-containing protein [bacterium]